jgi:DNA-binding NtrC family response regulator
MTKSLDKGLKIKSLDDVIYQYLLTVLGYTKGNRREAAVILGRSQRWIYYQLNLKRNIG